MLLGVDGVCIISHGSSSARAILNAVRVAHEMATGDLVGSLRSRGRPVPDSRRPRPGRGRGAAGRNMVGANTTKEPRWPRRPVRS